MIVNRLLRAFINLFILIILNIYVFHIAIADSIIDLDLKAIVDQSVSDLFSKGSLAKGYNWNWVSLDSAVPLSEANEVDLCADKPLNPIKYQSSEWGLSRAIKLVLDFGEVQKQVIPQRVMDEQSYYKRVLFKRTNKFVQIFLGLQEYTVPLQPSRFIRVYDDLFEKWVKALDHFRMLVASNAPIKEIEQAKDQLNQARRLWDIDGYRKILTVILQRYRMNLIANPLVDWNNAEKCFLEGGAWIKVRERNPGQVQLRSNLASLEWRTLEIKGKSENVHKVQYTHVFLNRPWLNHGMLFLSHWRWNEAAPFDKKFLLSDGSSQCECNLPIPCISEIAILLRLSDISVDCSEIYLIGFIGEPLPAFPKGFQENKNEGVESTWCDDPRGIVSRRLRNGTL